MVNLGNDWNSILADEFEKEYYKELRRFLVNEYRTRTIYPNMNDIFNALKFTSFENTKAVILGQDPYHGENQAHGLCFSVLRGIEPPPSLKNIYKELESDVGFIPPMHGELTHWAKQGVLMLNAVLTVRAHQANSHKGCGWEKFTDRVIAELNNKKTPVPMRSSSSFTSSVIVSVYTTTRGDVYPGSMRTSTCMLYPSFRCAHFSNWTGLCPFFCDIWFI